MSGECSALATKPEVRKVEAQVDNKIDKKDEPKIIEKASAIGASIAVATLDPRVQKALAELAKIGSQIKALAGRIFNLFDKIGGILSLIGLLATSAQLLILNQRVDRQDKTIKATERIAENAVARANIAILKADAATTQANIAIDNAYKAQDKAAYAETVALASSYDAYIAQQEAKGAVTSANAATKEARTAIAAANAASVEAKKAITAANYATAKAEVAINRAAATEIKASRLEEKYNQLVPQFRALQLENSQLRGKLGQMDSDLDALRVAFGTLAKQIGAVEPQVDTNEKDIKIIRSGGDAGAVAGQLRDLQGKVDRNEANSTSKINQLQAELADTKTQLKEQQEINNDVLTKLGINLGLSRSEINKLIDTRLNSKTQELQQMNDKQYQDLLKEILGVSAVVGALKFPDINRALARYADLWSSTNAQTTPQALTQAATAGVCNTTRPGGCMQNNVVNPLRNNFNDLVNSAGTAFGAANNALLLRMQGTLGVINNTVTTIKSTTNATLGVVTHAKHGLEAIQNFASTAWRVTKADKIMQGVSLAMTVHNGMMLSNNLLSTVSEALNMTLNALNIRDETDSPIDLGTAVGSKIKDLVESMIGTEGYAELTARTAKANRIYQTGINVLDTTFSLFDSARSVAELTAENTGKIGNALRESGAVYEDAYEEFLEKVNPQNASMRRLDKFREGLEDVENVFSTINQVSSEVVEFQENVEQLKTEKEELREEVATALETQVEEKDTVKTQNQVGTEVSENDFDGFQDNT